MNLPDIPLSLQVKLGSIAVHVDEMLGLTGHAFDREALSQLLKDPEVVEWIAAMNKLAMLPVKRTMEDVRLAAKRRKP